MAFSWDSDLEAKYSRGIKTPDGVDRVITMTGWHWASLDWMNDNTYYSQEISVRIAFEVTCEEIEARTANNPENFGEELNLILEHVVWSKMQHFMDHPYDSANESPPPNRPNRKSDSVDS